MPIVPRRITAKIEGDFVVFLIGARLNSWWRLDQFKWLGDTMNAMIRELEQKPESGFLGHENWVSLRPVMIQYWRTPEQLMAYARSRDAQHYPVWVTFNREFAKNRHIGIWHETYMIKGGSYECIYHNMPPMGLARVASRLDAEGNRQTAQGRLGWTDGTDAPVSADGTELDQAATPTGPRA